MKKGAIILCGGKSSRMGRDKATLPFGSESMLQRVIRLVSQVVDEDRIVIVAAPNQPLPVIPATVTVANDEQPDRGPLEAISAGLQTMGNRADAVYITSCDVPLLVPAFVQRIFELLGDHQIAVPRDSEHSHPLAAVYRTSVLQSIRKLLQADQLRLRSLFDEVDTREIGLDELRDVDPQLETLENLNTFEDYRSALIKAGFNNNPAAD